MHWNLVKYFDFPPEVPGTSTSKKNSSESTGVPLAVLTKESHAGSGTGILKLQHL